jgi:hypothetical protein
MQMGRWPNGSYELTVSPTTEVSFTFTGNRPERWTTAEEPYLLGQLNNGYFSSVIAVTDIDISNKVITLAESPLGGRGCHPDKAWSIINVLEEIDEPGEYFIDKTNEILYFWPPSAVTEAELLLSTYGDSSARLFDIDGTGHVQFKNITFEMFRNRMSKVWSSDSVTFDGCIFRNGGGSSITFTSTTNLTIKNSQFYGLGSIGMAFSECGDRYSLTKSNNFITNNYFNGTGRWKTGLGYAPPVWLYSTNCGFTISHNTFENTRHCGLVVFGGVLATVEYNRFHHCAYEADDCAAIYTGGGWTGQQGAVYRYNEFYDIRNTNLPGNYGNHSVRPLYYDGPSGASAIGNIAHTLDDRIWFNNNGRDVYYKDNITVHADRVYYARDEDNSKGCDLLGQILAFDYDIPGSAWYETFPHLREIPNDCTTPDFNDYVHSFGTIESGLNWQCGDLTFGTGIPYYTINYGSILEADPKFLDEANLVFALSDNSPAYSISGFERIPWERIGQLDQNKATRGIPLDGAVDQSTSLNLYWAPAFEAGSHKVYIGTNQAAVTARSVGCYLGQVTIANMMGFSLSEGTTYYWAVDAFDASGEPMGSGDLWSFTTLGDPAVVGGVDGDHEIDLNDVAKLALYWQTTGCVAPFSCDQTDVNNSGTVDIEDLTFICESWLFGK